MRRWRQVLAAGALALALVHAGLWAHSQWRLPGAVSMAVPVAPARRLHVNIWKPVKDNTSWGFGGALAHEIDRPLTVIVWHYHAGTVRMTRLALVRLPTWPLLVITGGLGAAATWLWRRPGLKAPS